MAIFSKLSRARTTRPALIGAIIALVIALTAFAALYVVDTSTNIVSMSNQSDVDMHLGQYSDRSLERSGYDDEVTKNTITLDTTSTGAGIAQASTTGCRLYASLTADESAITAQDTAHFTLTVRNEGAQVCKNVSVSNYYSDNMSIVSASPKATASNYYWRIGNMQRGAEYVISFEAKQKATASNSSLEVHACVTGDNANDVCEDASVAVGTERISSQPSSPSTPTSGSTPTPAPAIPVPAPVAIGAEYGTWVWVSPVKMTDAYMAKVLSAVKDNNINVIYLTIDDYLDVHVLPEGNQKEAKKKAYADALEKFVMMASRQGVAVDAEAGWRDWAEASHKWKGPAIVDFVLWYNSTRTYKLRGFQYDVEPYLMPTYERNKAPLLKNFVQLVDETSLKLKGTGIKFTIVIPHFYDRAQKWTPSFAYGGKTTYTFNHLLRILDANPGSSIILMSYRNFAEGSDGTIAISDIEVKDATASGGKTSVIVAQEVGNVDPDYVTFYGKTKADYLAQVALINRAFTPYANFGGIAVHYIDPFIDLK